MKYGTSTGNFPVLKSDELHVWCVALERMKEQQPECWEWLDESEQGRANRFHFPVDRERFVISHGILRFILGEYLQVSPGNLNFSTGDRGKPFLKNESLQFNLSHSGDWVLISCALDVQVGVDVERQRGNFQELLVAKRYFHKQEHQYLVSLPSGQQEDAFYKLWACKEAVVKATGEGIVEQLQHFSVQKLDSDSPQVVWHDQQQASISLTAFTPASGYYAAVAALKPLNLQFFTDL